MENSAPSPAMRRLPNLLTLGRIAATPGIVVLLFWPLSRLACFVAALVFSAAAITDYLDGYYARRYAIVSTLGKFLDPLADKLLVIATLIMLASLQRVEGWIVCIIVGRELAITGLRGIAAEKGVVIAAEKLGKWKTGFQIGALIPLLIHYTYLGIPFHFLGMVTLWVALFLTILSGVDYFRNFWRLMN